MMANDGGVWIKVFPDQEGLWGIEGFGGFAEITDVTGSPKLYTGIMVGGVEFWAFEWTNSDKAADNSLTLADGGGLLDTFLVSGGAKYQATKPGNAGDVRDGIRKFDGGRHSVYVGRGGGNTPHPLGAGNGGGVSSIGSFRTGSAGLCENGAPWQAYGAQGYQNGVWDDPSAIEGPDVNWGITTDFTGSSRTFATAVTSVVANSGNSPNTDDTSGASGIVICRVPASRVTATGGWV